MAANRDGRKIVNKGEPANFLVYYPVDDDTSKHNLTLDGYGGTAPTTAPLGAARAGCLSGGYTRGVGKVS